MSSADQWIDKFLERVRIGEFLKHAAEFGALFLFTFGTIVLAVKLLVPQLWPYVLCLALGAVPTAAAAWWRTRRDWRRREESAAMLDQSLGAGGLLMTLCERPDPCWEKHLPQLELQYREALPKYRPKRFAGFLAAPLMFAVAACFVPLREASTSPALKNSVAHNATQELEELLSALQETPALKEEEQEHLQQELRRLAEEAEQRLLTSENWETLDALHERIQIRLENTNVNLSKALEAADQLKRAQQNGEELTLEQKLRLEKNLTDALKKLGGKGNFQNAPAELRKNLLHLMKDGKLNLVKDPGQRQRQLDDLQDYLNDELQKLEKIRAQHNDGQRGRQGQQGGSSQNGNGRPGRGGVNRGRGDASMSWGEESDEQGVKFTETALPEGFREQPKDERQSVKPSAPEVDPANAAPRGAARAGGPAAGSTTTQRRLSPKHRAAVRKYFSKTEP